MKNKTKLLIGFCVFGFLIAAKAQQAIPASGGDASGNGGSICYSVGQIAFKTNTGSDGTVSEGVQQPYEILTIGLDKAKEVTLEYSVYPNPTYGLLKLKADNFAIKDLWYRLYDMDSKLLLSKKIDASEMDIPMKNFVLATYLFEIIDNQKIVKTFKIIKTR